MRRAQVSGIMRAILAGPDAGPSEAAAHMLKSAQFITGDWRDRLRPPVHVYLPELLGQFLDLSREHSADSGSLSMPQLREADGFSVPGGGSSLRAAPNDERRAFRS